jgi:hypothetical protein
MATSETTSPTSVTQVGKEHSNSLFINEILVIIITKNINLTFLSYCN